jgi:hypothetical protein
MIYLKEAASPVDPSKIDRCVYLLKVSWLFQFAFFAQSFAPKDFLEACKTPLGVLQHDRGHPVLVYVFNNIPDTPMKELQIKMHSHDSISILRHKISEKIQVPPESVIMLLGSGGAGTEAGGMELSDERTLKDFGAVDKLDISIQKYSVKTFEYSVQRKKNLLLFNTTKGTC